MALHSVLVGDDLSPGRPVPTGAPLVLAHGFTQNVNCWGRFAQLLAERSPVRAVDMAGHGQSGHDDADLAASGELLAAAGGSGIYVGYSMGGRVALHTALAHPELVQGLVLIGATAGLDDPADRAKRRAADDALATRLVDDGLPQFLDRWLANPLFAGLDDESAARTQRLSNRAEGLAASLRACGTGTQQPLWDRLGQLAMPVLIIVGDQDKKFTTIGRRMAAAMTATDAELLSIPGTHAVHLEKPDETAAAVLERIARWSGT
ncbi:MAG: alpha/beta fold hydrolase [Acidimicrobiales bacterium]